MKLPDANLQVYKTKNLSHIFVHAFCLHFIRTHQDYFFQKSFRNRSFRSSHSEVFLGKDILKICSRFKGECPCRSVILIKLLCNFIEITLQHGCSPINLLHIFRTPFLKNTSGWSLLKVIIDSNRFQRLKIYQTLLIFFSKSFLWWVENVIFSFPLVLTENMQKQSPGCVL